LLVGVLITDLNAYFSSVKLNMGREKGLNGDGEDIAVRSLL
jgi:hypothetical protein